MKYPLFVSAFQEKLFLFSDFSGQTKTNVQVLILQYAKFLHELVNQQIFKFEKIASTFAN